MSLMRLLTMGRSLNEVKTVGRYHVPREVGLPQFSFGKPAVKFSSAPATTPVTEAVKAKSVTIENSQAGVAENAVKPPAAGGWMKRSNPFAAAAVPAVVQAELTLDQVKVARNDLSEADFEIVPRQELPRQAEIKPYRKRNQPAAVPANDVLGAKAWNWLGSRLFGAAARQ
jgi:hypothetical protein